MTQNGALLEITDPKNLQLIFLVNGGLITVNQLQFIPIESCHYLALFDLHCFQYKNGMEKVQYPVKKP